MERIMTEREAYRFAFGPDPDPECDGAGRDCYAELMRRIRGDRRERVAQREAS